MGTQGQLFRCVLVCGMVLLGLPVFLQWKEKHLNVYRVHWIDEAHWKRIFRHLAFGLIYGFSDEFSA